VLDFDIEEATLEDLFAAFTGSNSSREADHRAERDVRIETGDDGPALEAESEEVDR